MFKNSLLAATALVLVVSVGLASERDIPKDRIHPRFLPYGMTARGAHRVPATIAIGVNRISSVAHNTVSHWTPGAIFNNFSKDKNAEFMSWYGFSVMNGTSSYYHSASSWYRVSNATFTTFPIIGTGNAPKLAKFPGYGYSSQAKLEVAILSSVNGLPGRTVATTSSTTLSETALCCTGVRTVKFSGAPALQKGTQYFVAVECGNANCYGGWNLEDTDFSGDTEMYCVHRGKETYNFGTGTHTFSYSSPPYCSPIYPATGAVVIK